jgi:hypothetical protein
MGYSWDGAEVVLEGALVMVRPTVTRQGGWRLAIFLLVTSLPACGTLLGIEAGTPEMTDASTTADARSRDASGRDGRADGRHHDVAHDAIASRQDAPIRRDAEAGGAEASASDAEDAGHLDAGVVDAADGDVVDAIACPGEGGVWGGDADFPIVYVSTTGCDGLYCGAKATPCRTIQHGIDRAAVVHATSVYVGTGTYSESVTLASGLTVQGGFTSTWDPTDGGAATIIQGMRSPTVQLSGVTAATTLSTVTVWGKETADLGESLYGIFATGDADGGTFTLDNVIVSVADAGAGAAGASPGAATPAAASCAAGNGADGGSGSTGGTSAGAFGASGYTPGNGGPGTAAAAGQNGSPGQSNCTTDDCVHGCQSLICGVSTFAPACAGGGAPGCGGGAGQGGGGGGGGGSSVGVFVWGAVVVLSHGSVQAGNGGDGAPGTAGSQGAAGSAGAAGASTSCVTGTSNCIGSCVETSESATGGAGTAGGNGGLGGTGGGGSGGSSYALFYKTPPVIIGTALTGGKAGKGAAGAPDGQAGAQGSPP